MENDIQPPQIEETPTEQTEQPPAQGGDFSSFMKKKIPSKLFPYMTVAGLIGIIIGAFVIGFAIAWSFIKWREPITPTYAGGYSGGSLGCYLDDNVFTDRTTALYGNDPTTDAGLTAAAEAVISKVGDINSTTLSQPKNKSDLKYVIQKSYEANINPAILISFWAGESGFKDSGKALGCALGDTGTTADFESQARCAITPVKQAINNESPYDAAGKPPGDKNANTWDRLLSNYAMDPMQQRYTDFKYTTTESDARITILKQLVPDQVVCRSTGAIDGILAVPGLSQKAPEWHDASIFSGGCFLTSIAMVDNYFHGKKTPVDIKRSRIESGKELASKEGYLYNNDTFTVAENFSINPSELFPAKRIRDDLAKNQPVIMRFKQYGGDYNEGHYVVIVGISKDKDGQMLKLQEPDQGGSDRWKNGNPPISRPSTPALYGNISSDLKFEFWALKEK